jgi:hypothetical protein
MGVFAQGQWQDGGGHGITRHGRHGAADQGQRVDIVVVVVLGQFGDVDLAAVQLEAVGEAGKDRLAARGQVVGPESPSSRAPSAAGRCGRRVRSRPSPSG